jgi:hypothetical protein
MRRHTPHFGDSTCKALILSVVARRSLVSRVVRLWGPPGLSGALLVARAWKFYWNPFRIDGVFWALFGRVRELCQNSVNSNREPTLVGIPTTLPQSGWFTKHSKLSNHFSYVIWALTYRLVDSDIVLLYIRSRVWGIIYAVGPSVVTVQTPQRPFPCDGRGRS